MAIFSQFMINFSQLEIIMKMPFVMEKTSIRKCLLINSLNSSSGAPGYCLAPPGHRQSQHSLRDKQALFSHKEGSVLFVLSQYQDNNVNSFLWFQKQQSPFCLPKPHTQFTWGGEPGSCITNIIATCRKNLSQWEQESCDAIGWNSLSL